jgi:uncharacterized membrane protein YdjX (TVP38/TMEM64 family)
MKIGVPVLYVVLCIVAALIATQTSFVTDVRSYIGSSSSFSTYAYVFLLFSVGVYLPLNAIPLIPFGAGIFGPLWGAILSSIGWILGALCSFWISRRYGRSFVEHFMPLQKIDALLEQVPQKNRFFATLVFRLVLPSDTASYALGLTKSLGFRDYFLATTISYTLYSFLLSYLGHALFEGELMNALRIGLCILAIFGVAWYLLSRTKN